MRFDKIAKLDRSIVSGKLGDAPVEWLATHGAVFLGVFGFGQP
jgi:mRNA interferase MazF